MTHCIKKSPLGQSKADYAGPSFFDSLVFMSSSPKKIYFGGSFYPPHLAHSEMLQRALLHDTQAELVLIPTHQNPLKESPGASLELIQAWLEDLADSLSYQQFSRLTLDLTEFNKVAKSYTVDTLEEIQGSNEKWVLLLGSDSAESFAQWKNPLKLLQLISEIWIIPRTVNSEDSVKSERTADKIKKSLLSIHSQTQIEFLESVTEVSSTQIRNGTTSQPLSELLSPRVLSVWKTLSL